MLKPSKEAKKYFFLLRSEVKRQSNPLCSAIESITCVPKENGNLSIILYYHGYIMYLPQINPIVFTYYLVPWREATKNIGTSSIFCQDTAAVFASSNKEFMVDG